MFDDPSYEPKNPFFTGFKNLSTDQKINAGLGAAQLGLNAYYMGQQGTGLKGYSIPSSQYDSFSAPTYTAGDLENRLYGMKAHGASGGEIGSGVAQGAAVGAAAGPVGAVVGAVVGAGASIIGGAARKRRQQREIDTAKAKVAASQQQYNQQDISYRSRQNTMNDYYRRNNPALGEYNVYATRINNGF